MSEELSQDEINKLMENMDSGSDSSSSRSIKEDEIQNYDFSAQERMVGRLSGFSGINERFVRQFRTNLMNFFRRSVDLFLEDIVTVKCNEYFSQFKVPSCFNMIRMRPLVGSAVIYFSNRLVFRQVDYIFGGSQNYQGSSLENREFTQMELRIVNIVLGMLIQDLSDGWKSIFPVDIEPYAVEFNPQLINVGSRDDIIVVKKFRLDIEGEVSEIHIAIPYAMVEPIRSSLEVIGQGDQVEINELWNNALREEVFSAPVEIYGTLAEIKTSLARVLEIKKGDILPVLLKEKVVVCAAGLPTLIGKFGTYEGHYAVQIVETLDQSKGFEG